jgi:hypothetical protein
MNQPKRCDARDENTKILMPQENLGKFRQLTSDLAKPLGRLTRLMEDHRLQFAI